MLVKVGSIWLNPERVAFVRGCPTRENHSQVWFSGVEGEGADYWVVEQPVHEVVDLLTWVPRLSAHIPQVPALVELPDQNGDPFMLAPAEIASLRPHESRNASGVIRKHTWITMKGSGPECCAEHCVGLSYEDTKRRLRLA